MSSMRVRDQKNYSTTNKKKLAERELPPVLWKKIANCDRERDTQCAKNAKTVQ